jgi:hypothetical protein
MKYTGRYENDFTGHGQVAAGDRFHMRFTASSYPVTMVVATAPELVRLREYLVAPTGMEIVQVRKTDTTLA